MFFSLQSFTFILVRKPKNTTHTKKKNKTLASVDVYIIILLYIKYKVGLDKNSDN